MASFGEFVDQMVDESPMIQSLRQSFFEEGFQAGIRQGLEQEIQQEELNLIIRQVLAASDVDAARKLLETGPE